MPLQKWSEQIWVAQMSPEPAFSEELETLSAQYDGADESPHLVLDLSGVHMLNSSNLSHMLRVRKQATDQGQRVKIAGPSNAIWSVFLTMGLDKVFEFSQDTTTALAELQLGG